MTQSSNLIDYQAELTPATETAMATYQAEIEAAIDAAHQAI
jgi:hypothetical protein